MRSLLERVLDVLASLLGRGGLRLVALALGLQRVVVLGFAGGLFGFSHGVLGGVLGLVCDPIAVHLLFGVAVVNGREFGCRDRVGGAGGRPGRCGR